MRNSGETARPTSGPNSVPVTFQPLAFSRVYSGNRRQAASPLS